MIARLAKPFIAAAALALAVAPGCKPKPPVPVVKDTWGDVIEPPPPPKAEDEQAASAIEADARALADAGDEEGAQAKRDLLTDTYPGTAAGARELERRGRLAEEAGAINEAITLYEKLLFYRPAHPGADAVRERYAALLQRVGRYGDSATMLRALYESATSDSARERIGMPLAVALGRTKKSREALEVYVSVSALAGATAATKKEAGERALDIVAAGLGFKEAEDLWDDVEGSSQWREILPALSYKLAKIYYHTRDYDRSEDMAKLVASRFAATPYGSYARDLLARLRKRLHVEPLSIGVLLPLSGRYQQYGKRSLAAMQMAIPEGTRIKLVVKDTGGNPTKAAKGVEDLVFEDHVLAIIGPLFSNEALAAALKAEELSIPLIALSHRDGLPEIGDYVFRTALTVKAQAKALAKVAFESLGITRFALLYPRSRYGKEFANAFWDEVNRRKGEIRGVESYEHDQTSFQEPIRKLVGRYYRMSRRDYREAIHTLYRQKLPPHIEKRKRRDLEKMLVPITDFEAIVIPDSGRNIGLIAPSLAFEDIVMTRDKKMLEKIEKTTGRDNIKPVTLLGGSTWNTIQTLESCEMYCENAIFVDAYYPDSPDPKVRDFVTGFRDATGAEPYLWEAQAFDTAGVVKWVLAANAPKDRKAFREALLEMRSYDGATGRMHFEGTGEVAKDLLVLTIKKDREGPVIRLWVPDAESPRG